MSLYLSLNNALTGLNVNRQALAVLSQNIANANTPNYSRKILDQQSNIIAGGGYGVRVEDISRKVDQYLVRAAQQQSSIIGRAQMLDEFSQRIQVLIGKPGNLDSIDASITNFYTTLQQLAQTPESGSLRLSGVNSGVALARQVSQLATDLHDLRYEADQEIKRTVDRVNTAIRDLSDVNAALAFAYNSGSSQAELLDRRDALIKDIGGYLDINYYFDKTNAVRVSTSNGFALVDSAMYQLSYTPQGSIDGLINDASFQPVQVYMVDSTGKQLGQARDLVIGGTSATVTTGMTNGSLRGLLEMRDSKIPAILEQLDQMAANLRDQFNILHNSGSSFPGANSYTGTRAVAPGDAFNWSGSTRIALLDANGQPVVSPYSDETSGVRPLMLDLSSLSAGFGAGQPTTQAIINEINHQFNQPQNRASLGDINNIRLVSDSIRIPGPSNLFNFDFDLENISGGDANFFLTGVQVLDDTNTDITSITSTIPSIALAGVNTFETTVGSPTVRVNTAAAHGLQEGDLVFMNDPGVTVGGSIPGIQFAGYFRVSNVTTTSYEIELATPATSAVPTSVLAQTATPKYLTVETGNLERTAPNGLLTQDVTANPTSQYYTIRANVAVENADGTVSQGVVQYRVLNPATNNFNQRYSVEAVSGGAQMHTSPLNAPLMKAILVDENGNELPKLNNAYVDGVAGYVKIVATNPTHVIAIDSLDSQQLGLPNGSPPIAGTNWGFSQYFGLNNFFEVNNLTSTGDTVKGSAINLKVEDRLVANANLISLGNLTQSNAPANPDLPPLYTYMRTSGNNALIQQLAELGTRSIQFQSAGGLGSMSTTFNAYAGQILGFVSSDAASNAKIVKSAQTILDGFNERTASISGVNLDEELANTIIYQNAYTASARVITVTNTLFDTLLNTFTG